MSQASIRPRTPDQILGPYFPVGCQPSRNGDLTSIKGRSGEAKGEIIELVGRVLNRAGKPMPAARLLIWQANSFGRYTHPNDSHQAPLDPNFIGFAEICADHDGGYRIRTDKPGAYPLESGEMRAPHIHFEVYGRFERLITQMYFPGEPLNACDRYLRVATHPNLLLATSISPTTGATCAFRFDVVLGRG